MKLSRNKGSIITTTIMTLGLLSLIAVPNLAGIRGRSQVSADIRTAEQIGKAVRIWVTDADYDDGRELPTSPVEYDELEDLTDTYISSGYTAKSYRYGIGKYYVSSSEEYDGQKVRVAIAESEEDAENLTEYDDVYDGTGAAWAYIEW